MSTLIKPLTDSERVAKPCAVCGNLRPFHKRNSAGVAGWNSCELHKDAPALLAALKRCANTLTKRGMPTQHEMLDAAREARALIARCER